MKQADIHMKTFLITANDEVAGEGVEFTNGYCMVWWYENRSPLTAYTSIQALIDLDTKEKYIIQYHWER